MICRQGQEKKSKGQKSAKRKGRPTKKAQKVMNTGQGKQIWIDTADGTCIHKQEFKGVVDEQDVL